jgi:glycosyltransferase involved in cell wall biosynthesis
MDLTESQYPLISVITVSFNAVEFIEQTINSVLSQTYFHIEYIIIDGASTDGTTEVIRKYESRLAYWHSRPDRGLAHAFNLGLSHAHGAWILFLNADDFFLDSTVVETMIPFLTSNRSYDVIYGQAIYMTQSKNPRPAPFRKIIGEPWSWQKFRWTDTIPHPASFNNQRYFAMKGWFDESYRVIVDYELYLRGGKELRARFFPVPLIGIREGGLSGKNMVRTFAEGRLAHQKNQVLPAGLAWINFFAQLGRFYLGRLFHRLFDRFAHKIICQDRNCANLLK